METERREMGHPCEQRVERWAHLAEGAAERPCFAAGCIRMGGFGLRSVRGLPNVLIIPLIACG